MDWWKKKSYEILLAEDDKISLLMLESNLQKWVTSLYPQVMVRRNGKLLKKGTIVPLTIPGGMGGKRVIEKMLEINPNAKAEKY